MCGIAGFFSPKGINIDCLNPMSSAIKHRGPDGYGFMLFSKERGIRVVFNDSLSKCEPNRDTVGFAHRRLSIIDLSEGSLQPMKEESNNYCVTYNGELYNYLKLKKELQSLGYSFKTTGDTEVLLRAYEAWGAECMKRFNGMWAFVLLDTKNQCLILSRDRFGIKPLYYTIHDNTIYFASEIKGLLAIPFLNWEPNEKTVAKYLITGLVDDTEETFFKGIYQFPAACWAKISFKENRVVIRPEPYWSLPTGPYQGAEQNAIREFKELFLDSVEIHTQSDVPVGTCLSGGLDSSSIVCVSDLLRKSLQIPNYSHSAFGYCPSEECYSEKKYMDVVVEKTSVKMHKIDFSQNQFQIALPLIIQIQDEPFSSASIIAQWFVFQKAKEEGITVMLDGQGADEILAGYHTYFATMALNLLFKRRIFQFLLLRSQYEREIGKFPLSYRIFSLGSLLSFIPYPFINHLKPVMSWLRKLNQKNPISPERISLTGRLFSQYPMGSIKYKKRGSLNEELKTHLQSTSLPALLRYEDRNSMAHSIEARVPFLDYRLVEFLFKLPDDLKIKGVTTKYILREAMKGILPEAIRNRKDKVGFQPNPNITFLFAQQYINSLKDNKTDYEKLWFDKNGIENILKSKNRTVAFEFFLWRILNLKLWVRQHWEGK
jgi:asparagine synthase (glutamine-hydrolysing)